MDWKSSSIRYKPSTGKARRATFGFKEELLRSAESSSHVHPFYFIFRLFARPEDVVLLLIQIHCRWCGLIFCICRACSGTGLLQRSMPLSPKTKKHCEAQRRYRRTQKGKKTHRESENRRRHGLSENNQKKHG